MELKTKIKSLDDLYIKTFYFYNYGRYVNWIKIVHNENKPYLQNEVTNEIIKGLQKINQYLAIHNLEFEEV